MLTYIFFLEVIEALHHAAYRGTGLGNSLYMDKHLVGAHNSNMVRNQLVSHRFEIILYGNLETSFRINKSHLSIVYNSSIVLYQIQIVF